MRAGGSEKLPGWRQAAFDERLRYSAIGLFPFVRAYQRTVRERPLKKSCVPSAQLTGLRMRIYPQKRASRIKGLPNLFTPVRSLTKSLNHVLIDCVILYALSQIVGVYI